MGTFNITTEIMEKAIDQDGAWNVLIAMELVLADKATHLRLAWQDEKTAKVYDMLSAKAGKLARECEKHGV